jgi:(p)ppGpp synthase/HD superfamily hydrolase
MHFVYQEFEQVHAALGRGDIGPTAVIKRFFPDHDPAEAAARQPTALGKIAARLRISGKGVRIQGMDNLMVRYSRCCQPVPGDPVIGYVTRGRGVSIHRDGLPQRACPFTGSGAPNRNRVGRREG